MKAKKNLFDDVKIKMVMRLKNLSRAAAVAEIAKMDALHRKTAEDARKAEESERTDRAKALVSHEEDFLSAAEFFGEES